jgi:NADPH-dependent 2,4-dienoyl-CoA reductase/sulfur reductase-like enzyme
MQAHGVALLLEHDVTAFVGDEAGTVAGIKTNHGDYDADLAVVTIGVVPNTAWLKQTPIRLNAGGAIEVDASQRTNVEGVYAAGDCAAVRWFDGSVRPEQLFYTSRDQGRIAARAILGDDIGYHRGIWYNSAKLMDIEYTTVGYVNMKLQGEQNCYLEEQGSVRSTMRFVVVGEQVVGFNALGRRWDHSVILRWIEEKRSLSWAVAHLQDASFDTEMVPPLAIETEGLLQRLTGPAENPYLQGPTACPLTE